MVGVFGLAMFDFQLFYLMYVIIKQSVPLVPFICFNHLVTFFSTFLAIIFGDIPNLHFDIRAHESNLVHSFSCNS